MDKILYEIFSKIESLCNFAQGYMESFQEETANEQNSQIEIKQLNKASQEKEAEDLRYKQTSINHREDGRIEIRYRRNGYNKSFYGRNEKEAKIKFNEWYNQTIKNKTNKQKRIEQKNITINEWIHQWLEIYKKPNVAIKTYENIKMTVHKYIEIPLNNKKINSITNEDIQDTLNKARFQGRPQNKVNTYIKAIFETARLNKLIKDNPTEGTKFKKHQDVNSVALSKEEQEQFKIEIKNTQLEKYYLFILYTGCRRSEALDFRLSDIKDNEIHIKGTKTEKSDRFIPFFKEVKELLKDCKEDIVFPFSPLTVTRNFRTYSPNHTLRDLRKTFSSNCHEKGISPKVVQKWLGHTNLSMTMNVYTEVSKDFEKEELKKLDK